MKINWDEKLLIFLLYIYIYELFKIKIKMNLYTNIRYESNKICNILFEMKFILVLYRENYFFINLWFLKRYKWTNACEQQ